MENLFPVLPFFVGAEGSAPAPICSVGQRPGAWSRCPPRGTRLASKRQSSNVSTGKRSDKQGLPVASRTDPNAVLVHTAGSPGSCLSPEPDRTQEALGQHQRHGADFGVVLRRDRSRTAHPRLAAPALSLLPAPSSPRPTDRRTAAEQAARQPGTPPAPRASAPCSTLEAPLADPFHASRPQKRTVCEARGPAPRNNSRLMAPFRGVQAQLACACGGETAPPERARGARGPAGCPGAG